MTKEDRVRLRHTDRFVGALVLLAVAIFLGALFQRGLIREWFEQGDTLTVLLPQEGVAGLAVGADVEVLGIRAGTVRRIIVDPERRLRAEVRIEEQAKPFIRSDSIAVIRRRFGVAGAAYIDIQRGEGAPLVWSYATIEATSERAPTETLGTLLEELQQRVFPILDELKNGTAAFASAAQRLDRGEGTVGRLLSDDTLARQAERAATQAADLITGFQGAASDVRNLTTSLNSFVGGGANGRRNGAGTTTLPQVLARADRVLANLETASREIAGASPSFGRTARNVENTTDTLPALVVQAQETARELELLLNQLRGSALLGAIGAGSPGPARPIPRPAVERVRP